MAVGELERVNDAKELIEVATSRGRVREGQTELLRGVNDEDGANGLLTLRGIRGIRRNHAVQVGNLLVLVANDGVRDGHILSLVDVVDPLLVGLDIVGREGDGLDVSLLELGEKTSYGAELGRANLFEAERGKRLEKRRR